MDVNKLRNVLGLGLGEPCFQSRGMVSFIGKTILRLVSEGRGLKVRKTWGCSFSKVFYLVLFQISTYFSLQSKSLVHWLQILSK